MQFESGQRWLYESRIRDRSPIVRNIAYSCLAFLLPRKHFVS